MLWNIEIGIIKDTALKKYFFYGISDVVGLGRTVSDMSDHAHLRRLWGRQCLMSGCPRNSMSCLGYRLFKQVHLA